MASVMESARLGGYVTQFEQVNSSISKQKYSFGVSKGSRFPAVKRLLNNVAAYDLPNTNTKRACSFGVGTRFSTPVATRQI
jgi:hypothetical protein